MMDFIKTSFSKNIIYTNKKLNGNFNLLTKLIQNEKVILQEIKDNFSSLWEFTKFLATINVYVSTSTGPMHLASLSNTKTLSFFGNTKFASYKRWKPESSDECQKNFLLPTDFDIIVKGLKEMI